MVPDPSAPQQTKRAASWRLLLATSAIRGEAEVAQPSAAAKGLLPESSSCSLGGSPKQKVWVKIKPPGIGPQDLVHVSIYQGSFWVPIFDPHPYSGLVSLFSSSRTNQPRPIILRTSCINRNLRCKHTLVFPQQLKALGSQPREAPGWSGAALRSGSTRVPPKFHQGSTRVPRGSARSAWWCEH